MSTRAQSSVADTATALTGLLGDVRAQIVEILRQAPDKSVTELAEHLGISAVATRRHLAVLEEDGLVVARTVKQHRGRPAARFRVTATANRLLPHRYDAFATDLVDYLVERHGSDALREFLRWRMSREIDGLGDIVTAEDLHERLEQLADALSNAGFDASVDEHGGLFTLVQGHCAIEEVAKEHPEICAYEAASFSKVLGRDVTLSRRETMAAGASSCICTVAPRRESMRTLPEADGTDITTAAVHTEQSERGAQR